MARKCMIQCPCNLMVHILGYVCIQGIVSFDELV